MRFSEKLPKLRKDNNLSQEQLADKLGVSRQAVSKWESGNSYPDMEKMLQMCRILNCHLEDIMDDGAIGQESQKLSKNKIDLNAYMEDFLDFITRSYNMFCSMKFKEKIKCLFEMAIIALIVLLASNIVYSILEYIIYGLIPIAIFWKVVSILIKTTLIVISMIIFIHLFKIRYLDYFVTIEDQNVTEKTIEDPIEKKEDRHYQEKAKEKIIIRDPKHSTLKVFNVLGEILVTIIRVLAIFAIIPVIIAFVLTVGLTFASIFYIRYGVLFLFMAIAILGAVFIAYDIIELLYNFILDREQHFKRLFILGIIGLIMCGAGIGLSVCTYLNYEIVEDFDEGDYLIKTQNIEPNDELYIDKSYDCEYKIDNSVEDIQIEIKYIKGADVGASVNPTYEYCYFYYNMDPIYSYRMVINDLKNKKIRNYDNAEFMKIKITLSQGNYDKIMKNNMKVQ